MRTLYSQMYTRLQETVDGFREVSYLDELQTTMTTDNLGVPSWGIQLSWLVRGSNAEVLDHAKY
jgi:hypothetical protein